MDLLNETVLLKTKSTLFNLLTRETSQFLCYEILLNMTYVAYKNAFFREMQFWSHCYTVVSYQSKQGCKDQESIQSSTTPDPGYQWESDKLTEDTTHESKEASPFPAGDHEAHINRRAQNIANTRQNKNIKDPQKKYRLGTVSKIFYWRA